MSGRQISPPGIGGDSEPRNEASGVVLQKRERSELPYVSAQRSLLKTRDALSRGIKGGSLRSRFCSTTPLASFLGSLPLLSQEGKLPADRSSSRLRRLSLVRGSRSSLN